jgi:response regulator RpfG family c-di-GMP phosphodiesterase/serine/threonine protein kinase
MSSMKSPLLPVSSFPSDPSPPGRRQCPLAPSSTAFLDNLVQRGILSADEREAFLADRIDRLREYTSEERLGQALLQAGLLSPYQLDRIMAGSIHGLVLGNYRVLEELGRGGMGVVYLAEHRLMKRRVAVKVLPVDDDCPAAVRTRFFAEMRVLSELSHPNVVLAFDAGESPGDGALSGSLRSSAASAGLEDSASRMPLPHSGPPLLYLVTELVEGGDLEKYVVNHGLCSVSEACRYIRQAAAGLQAAHDRHLVHRDIKPSNLLLAVVSGGSSPLTTHHSPLTQVKLVDFGLARQFSSRLTDQRALLGSVEFMPPEQSHDPSSVGKEADIYSLGATLFWLLTGEGPFPYTAHIGQALRMLQQQEPRRLRSLRPDVPAALDAVVAQMLDRNPMRRPASAVAVMNALRPFLLGGPEVLSAAGPEPSGRPGRPSTPTNGAVDAVDTLGHCTFAEGVAQVQRALIVAEDPRLRLEHRLMLEEAGCECSEARDVCSAVESSRRTAFDVVLLDVELSPALISDVGQRLRHGGNPTLQVIAVARPAVVRCPLSVVGEEADPSSLTTECEPRRLAARVRQALELKACQDRTARLVEQVGHLHEELEKSLQARNSDLRAAHNALLFAIARIAESRDGETAEHLKRMQAYVRVLAVEAARPGVGPGWQGLVDERFLEQLDRCVPLHDIGKIGLPDDILLKPASLSNVEREMVQTHPLIGDRLLEDLAREHGAALDFLGMARVIVRSHHERWDGKGYPDRLAGEAIPPAARLVAVADVYDALRRMRLYKPALSHMTAIRMMVEQSKGQFDPSLLTALTRCHAEFERIYREIEE